MELVQIIGNLTGDPVSRVTQSGINLCSFSVAVNQPPSKAQRDAGQTPPAKFFRVTAWRELGDICAKYLAKGRKVYVQGTITASAYTAQDGSNRASLELKADKVEFLSSKSDAAAESGAAAPAAQSSPAAEFKEVTTMDSEELPF